MTSADMNPLTSHAPGLMGHEKYDDTRHIFELQSAERNRRQKRSFQFRPDPSGFALFAAKPCATAARMRCGVFCAPQKHDFLVQTWMEH